MFNHFTEFGTNAWITESLHFGKFLDLAYRDYFFGEIWLYNNDLDVLRNPNSFKELYCDRIFGDLWEKIDAVKILVSKKHEHEIFGNDGIIPSEHLRKNILTLSETQGKKGIEKLKSFFIGKMPANNNENPLDLPDDYNLVFYIHRHMLDRTQCSGIAMVRPHAYPFFDNKDINSPRYAIVWQMKNQPQAITERFLNFNKYFTTKNGYRHILIEDNEVKLSPGWSEHYKSKKDSRVLQNCDGLHIGDTVDCLVMASMYPEITHIEDKLETFSVPNLNSFRFAILRKNNGKVLKVILGYTGEGNLNAAVNTQKAISIWKPKKIILFGVAGGDPKDDNLEIGDIVVGEKIYGYEHAKVVAKHDNWEYESKQHVWNADVDIMDVAQRLEKDWSYTLSQNDIKCTKRNSEKVRVLFQHIASGNKLVVSSAYFNKLKDRISKNIKAVEMEGDGVGYACHEYGKSVLVVRGIVDKCTSESRGEPKNNTNPNNGDKGREQVRSIVSKITAEFVHDLMLKLI